MHVFQALQHLVDDILLVDVLEDVSSDYRVQVSIHEIEDQVDVSVIFSSNYILEPNDVLVPGQLLQEDDLSEGSLRIRGVLECIEVFLESDDLLSSFVDSLPDNTVRSLT